MTRPKLERTYPFNADRNYHNIRFVYEDVKDALRQIENGEIQTSPLHYRTLKDTLLSINILMRKMEDDPGAKIIYLTGTEIGVAKNCLELYLQMKEGKPLIYA